MRLEGVRFAFKAGRLVLSDVTATAEAGRVTGVIGPNGAGKSTLLRVMLGELGPTAGRVWIGKDAVTTDVHAMTARDRAGRLAYVPQRGAEAFGFTVREMVELGAWASGRLASWAGWAMGQAEVEAWADQPIRTLSVGQQQRVLVARALAQCGVEPGGVGAGAEGGVLLADEPTSAMDLKWREMTMGLLRQHAEAGGSVVVVLHDLTQAQRWADDVWVMQEGKLVEAGPKQAVMRADLLSGIWGVEVVATQTGAGRVWVAGG